MNLSRQRFVNIIGILALTCQFTPFAHAAEIQITPVSDIEWTPLNPARGEASPKAGTLWGDRSKTVPTGFLVAFRDGFSSPPHAHNTSYRAVVINGLIHNDDPSAAPMWMPTGSFWTQPKGEVHITAAKGETNIALVEIDYGPYLVTPSKDAFESGEYPINIHASNILWHTKHLNNKQLDNKRSALEVAYLWGDFKNDGLRGLFVKLPAGFVGDIGSTGNIFQSVVIAGQLNLPKNRPTLSPGSYISLENSRTLTLSNDQETIIYIRTNGKLQLLNK